MRQFAAIILAVLILGILLCKAGATSHNYARASQTKLIPARKAYLGFDRNDYPGGATLSSLRRTFSFSGYWLNPPPGETSTTWKGKRRFLLSNGFGFLVLFNGRLEKELESNSFAKALATKDAAAAVAAAIEEGFPRGTVIFLDQEEGGRLTAQQRAYVFSWADDVTASGYRAGIYCSGIPAAEVKGEAIVTANDIKEHSDGRKLVYFVYNDACPPSLGCELAKILPPPSASGVPFATVWQFAQSPRRSDFTARCAATYSADGNCYAPSLPGKEQVYLDLDSATSPDPSGGRD